MRKCPLFGCQADLPDHLFACRKHWFMLSHAQRRTIYDAYDRYMSDGIGVEELRSVQQGVIDAVHARAKA